MSYFRMEDKNNLDLWVLKDNEFEHGISLKDLLNDGQNPYDNQIQLHGKIYTMNALMMKLLLESHNKTD